MELISKCLLAFVVGTAIGAVIESVKLLRVILLPKLRARVASEYQTAHHPHSVKMT